MAPPKRKSGGRTTPKGTRPGQLPSAGHAPLGTHGQFTRSESGVEQSSRYTPPVPKYIKESPRWVPILMLTLFGLGALIILLFYLGAVPGGRSNWYLVSGLAMIMGGLYAATKYH